IYSYVSFSLFFCFFFSSRRRHTRFSRDWSSDVCSSDLGYSALPQITLSTGTQKISPASGIPVPDANNGELKPTAVLSSSSLQSRSEERRVGKECRSRWSP